MATSAPNLCTTKQEFQNSTVGWEFLFIFIAGMVGDLFVHLIAHNTTGTRFEFAQGLLQYYTNLGEKFLIWPTTDFSDTFKFWSGTGQGAFWGGVACIFALLIAKLFLFAKEETENK